jgi:hypothetical protein
MAQTLVEKWSALFPNGNPDGNRTRTSATSTAVRNPLSEYSGLDNLYTSLSTVPTGRKSQNISVLWDHFCGVKSDSDSDLDHLSTSFGANANGGQGAAMARDGMVSSMKKNVTVRSTEDTAAHETRALAATSLAAMFAIADAGPADLATVKSNYRLGAVNPDGGFSSYTGRPMSSGGDDIATISLQQYRDGMA